LFLVLVGIVWIAGSAYLFVEPPRRTKTESPTSGPASTTVVQAEPTTFSTAIFVAGAVLVIIAANGRKLVRVSKEGAEFDAPTQDQVFDDAERVKAPIEETGAPPVTPARPEKTFAKDGCEYQVFEPQDVPLEVLGAVSRGPGALAKTVADIDYAFRRTGKGNNTWFLKTRSGETVGVSFGGQGKTQPTVSTEK
jgi:hypothetical protein